MIGKRVRLLESMVNNPYMFNGKLINSYIPVEKIEVGTTGVIVHESTNMYMVRWDNGSQLNLILDHDKWEFVDD